MRQRRQRLLARLRRIFFCNERTSGLWRKVQPLAHPARRPAPPASNQVFFYSITFVFPTGIALLKVVWRSRWRAPPKVNFGNKFSVWVYFHTTILKSWKFQENRGRTVVVLPLWVVAYGICLVGLSFYDYAVSLSLDVIRRMVSCLKFSRKKEKSQTSCSGSHDI